MAVLAKHMNHKVKRFLFKNYSWIAFALAAVAIALIVK